MPSPLTLRIHNLARAEFDSAVDYYDGAVPGLGEDFVAAVTNSLFRIQSTPLLWPVWPGTATHEPQIRRALVKRFPFALAYQVVPSEVVVLAIAHLKRRPLYWLSRTGSAAG
jgi:hypothetical protein